MPGRWRDLRTAPLMMFYLPPSDQLLLCALPPVFAGRVAVADLCMIKWSNRSGNEEHGQGYQNQHLPRTS
jgi:hypothetical protein